MAAVPARSSDQLIKRKFESDGETPVERLQHIRGVSDYRNQAKLPPRILIVALAELFRRDFWYLNSVTVVAALLDIPFFFKFRECPHGTRINIAANINS